MREEGTGEVGDWERPLGTGLHIHKRKGDIELVVEGTGGRVSKYATN